MAYHHLTLDCFNFLLFPFSPIHCVSFIWTLTLIGEFSCTSNVRQRTTFHIHPSKQKTSLLTIPDTPSSGNPQAKNIWRLEISSDINHLCSPRSCSAWHRLLATAPTGPPLGRSISPHYADRAPFRGARSCRGTRQRQGTKG